MIISEFVEWWLEKSLELGDPLIVQCSFGGGLCTDSYSVLVQYQMGFLGVYCFAVNAVGIIMAVMCRRTGRKMALPASYHGLRQDAVGTVLILQNDWSKVEARFYHAGDRVGKDIFPDLVEVVRPSLNK